MLCPGGLSLDSGWLGSVVGPVGIAGIAGLAGLVGPAGRGDRIKKVENAGCSPENWCLYSPSVSPQAARWT